jgi:hypothetical protein
MFAQLTDKEKVNKRKDAFHGHFQNHGDGQE